MCLLIEAVLQVSYVAHEVLVFNIYSRSALKVEFRFLLNLTMTNLKSYNVVQYIFKSKFQMIGILLWKTLFCNLAPNYKSKNV